MFDVEYRFFFFFLLFFNVIILIKLVRVQIFCPIFPTPFYTPPIKNYHISTYLINSYPVLPTTATTTGANPINVANHCQPPLPSLHHHLTIFKSKPPSHYHPKRKSKTSACAYAIKESSKSKKNLTHKKDL